MWKTQIKVRHLPTEEIIRQYTRYFSSTCKLCYPYREKKAVRAVQHGLDAGADAGSSSDDTNVLRGKEA